MRHVAKLAEFRFRHLALLGMVIALSDFFCQSTGNFINDSMN